ncbi:phage protein [Shewanella subflava]|uniref:Phage protein n=1 Tax=Shewanella subflava TaxID=2986476 RepID=A0ABT3ICH3_9GAMM|nr:phage protein [Shewanella subflava]MCW3173742.1 phage protein [Shewanella subflava]
MKSETRFYFLNQFGNNKGGIIAEKAAQHFDVSPRTIRHWWRVGCPSWVNKFAEMAAKSIPDNTDWQGFSFNGNKLVTPFKRLELAPSELLMLFYDRQFHAIANRDNKQLNKQISALRNNEEAEAINEEIDVIIKTLGKLKNSPILAEKRSFTKAVAKNR